MSNFDELGFNFRFNDIQAAIGVSQCSKLDTILEKRRQLAEKYNLLLKEISNVIIPADCPGHSYQSYVIRIEREEWKKETK